MGKDFSEKQALDVCMEKPSEEVLPRLILSDFIGQTDAIKCLKVYCEATKKRKEPL